MTNATTHAAAGAKCRSPCAPTLTPTPGSLSNWVPGFRYRRFSEYLAPGSGEVQDVSRRRPGVIQEPVQFMGAVRQDPHEAQASGWRAGRGECSGRTIQRCVEFAGQRFERSRRRDVYRRHVGVAAERFGAAGEIQAVYRFRDAVPEYGGPAAQDVKGEAFTAGDAPGGVRVPGEESSRGGEEEG